MVEKGCILKIEHPLSSIDGACKIGEMTIVEKVSICDNNVGYSPKMEGYATLMSDINELSEIVDFGHYELEIEKIFIGF